MHQSKIFKFTDERYNCDIIEKTINDFLEEVEKNDRAVVRYLAELSKNSNNDPVFTIHLIHRALKENDPQRKHLKRGPQRFKTFSFPVYDNKDLGRLEEEINAWFQEMESEENEFKLSKSLHKEAYPENRVCFFYRMKKKEEKTAE